MTRPLKYKLDAFDALANPLRREMIAFLKRGEVPATALVEQFDITQPSLSRHLQVLRRANLVHQRKRGRLRLYRLNVSVLREIDRWIDSILK